MLNAWESTPPPHSCILQCRQYPSVANRSFICRSPAATGIHTLGPPQDDAFNKILQDQLAGFLGAGFRSRTNRLAAKRAASQMQPGRRGRWRGTLLELSGMEIGPEQVRSYPISSIVSTIPSGVYCTLLFASPFECVPGLA